MTSRFLWSFQPPPLFYDSFNLQNNQPTLIFCLVKMFACFAIFLSWKKEMLALWTSKTVDPLLSEFVQTDGTPFPFF